MTPEHIRIAGIVGVAVFLVYWIALGVLKARQRRAQAEDGGQGSHYEQNNEHGDNTMIFDRRK